MKFLIKFTLSGTNGKEMHRQYTNQSGSEAEEFTQEELQEFAQAFKVIILIYALYLQLNIIKFHFSQFLQKI